MKEISISWKAGNSPFSDMYYTTKPSFSFFSRKTNGIYHQACGWHTCRETFANEISRKLGVHGYVKSNEHLTLDHTRILVLFRGQKDLDAEARAAESNLFSSWIKEAVRVLNILERKLGWGLTQAYRVADKDTNSRTLSGRDKAVYALFASPKWMHSPQLLSLYLLIFRLCRAHQVSKAAMSKYEDFGNFVKALKAAKPTIKENSQLNSDICYFGGVQTKLDTIVANVDTLFFGRPLYDHFRLNDGRNGISSLIGFTADAGLRKKWQAVNTPNQKG